MRRAAIVTVLVALAALAYFGLRDTSPPVAPPPVADATTARKTSEGEVVGFVAANAATWLGIPFAQPPVGELRWRAPLPPEPRQGPLEALALGAMCPQNRSPFSVLSGDDGPPVAGSEDCLYLNIYAPTDARGLPVMFWIHGGGNTFGSGGEYVGANLASSQKVVVVTINYRMGPMGWFAHPALATGDPRDDSGNYGTLDIIRALEWTRDNIAAFGGDPGNVTVFGESAGGGNTLAMMASPLARGLFHRAIVQSGGFWSTPMMEASGYEADGGHPYSAREIVNRLLVTDGRAADRAAATAVQDGMSATELRDYLRAKPVEAIYGLWSVEGFAMIDAPSTFGDGHVLPALDAAAVFGDPARHTVVPVVLGTNRDEPTIFMVRNPEYTRTILGVIPRFRDEASYLRTVHYGGRTWKARGVDELAEHMTAAGNPNVFAYRFDWDEFGSRAGFDLGKALGASHFIEVPFVFGDFVNYPLAYLFPDEDPARDQLADSMMSYWANFAYTGDPARGRDGSLPRWLRWGTDGHRSIVLDTESGGGIRMMDEIVTHEVVLQELANDTTITDQRERCRIYLRSFGSGDRLNRAEYETLGPDGCAAYDPATLVGEG
jgi:para-nitrobenzyl esterase